jgi:AraC-like DNA-binding protein
MSSTDRAALSPAQGTVSVLVLRSLIAGASALGLDGARFAQACELAPDALAPALLADPDARVPASHVLSAWRALGSLSGRPDFGLWLAEQLGGAPITIASWVILKSPTLGAGLARALRYQRLLHDHARSELVESADQVTYRHQVGAPPFRAPSAAIEFGFASLIALARKATGQAVFPKRLRVQHRAPADLSAYRRWFGSELEFEAAADELVFDRRVLELPLLTADGALREIVEAHAESLLRALPDTASVQARVRSAIVARLANGTPSVAELADELGLPARTLQRHLAAEGTSFADQLDAVRRELAERYLRDRRISVQDAAFLLGFSEVSAFHRAFQRWTGLTPARFRAGSQG